MAKIILFPTHEGYCRTCAYSSGNGTCNNKSIMSINMRLIVFGNTVHTGRRKLNNGRKKILKK